MRSEQGSVASWGVVTKILLLFWILTWHCVHGFTSSGHVAPAVPYRHPKYISTTNTLADQRTLFHYKPRHEVRLYQSINGDNASVANVTQELVQETAPVAHSAEASQDGLKNMLQFALPALGIYLSNPMLSNIDNAFVGRTAGVTGLAALSPATICTDQMLYLFSFLSRATTGLVSRAYGVTQDAQVGDTEAARQAASAPMTMALVCGVALSAFYAVQTPQLLSLLQVQPAIRPAAASYIYWRGAIAWAALAQAVALSVMMATRDAVTPLKIIGLAAGLNIVGDYALCVWPVRWGCSGAAAATAAATVMSSGFMLRGLRRKGLLPHIRMPSWKELKGLLEFTGPLMAITLTRLGGFISMQRRAMSLGVQQLAAYQLGINMMIFFVLFGEPLSQLFQTKLPALIDVQDRASVGSTFRSVMKLAGITSISIAALSGLSLYFGAPFFTSDVVVQGMTRQVALPLFAAVCATIMGIAIDGAMLASRDFGFILTVGFTTFLTQITLLQRCHTIPAIFGTFTLRLGSYFGLAALRLVMGYGALGQLLRPKSTSDDSSGPPKENTTMSAAAA